MFGLTTNGMRVTMMSHRYEVRMKTVDAIEWAGGTMQKLADKLNMKARSTICEWGEYPPLLRQYQIQVVSKGQLKAERNGHKAAT